MSTTKIEAEWEDHIEGGWSEIAIAQRGAKQLAADLSVATQALLEFLNRHLALPRGSEPGVHGIQYGVFLETGRYPPGGECGDQCGGQRMISQKWWAGLDAQQRRRAALLYAQECLNYEAKKRAHKEMFAIQSGRCAGCDMKFSERRLYVDRIFPLSKGGTDSADNLQLLCSSCDSLKGEGDMDYLRMQLAQVEMRLAQIAAAKSKAT